MPLTLDDQWIRINDDFDLDGKPLVPQFARMVRTSGGMIVGRIVRDQASYQAHRYRFGRFSAVGESKTSISDAFRALEEASA